MISVWEKSVRKTHDFLLAADIEYYKSIVSSIDYNTFDVFCMTDGNDVMGFIGIIGNKIEMLFLAPEFIGKGHGKALINFAIQNLQATLVDVNEQNISAVNFYAKQGFVAYERTEKDSEGKDYPILKMRLI